MATSREPGSRDVPFGDISHPPGEVFGPRWTWLFLAGPFLWLVYFQVSNSAAAMSCAPDLLGVGVWSFVGVVGATVLGVGMYSRRSLRGRLVSPAATKQALAIGGSLLGASILVGLPLLFSQPC